MATKLARVPPLRSDELEDPGAEESLLGFESESESEAESEALAPFESATPAPLTAAPSPRRFPVLIPFAMMGGLAAVALAIAYVFQASRSPEASAPPPVAAVAVGTVTFTSEPAGANVFVDGVARGITPLKLQLTAGMHEVELAAGATTKKMPLTVDAATVMAQHVEFAGASTAETGRLEVTSDPPGARVTVDGVQRGATPLTLTDVAIGERRIVIGADQTTVQRTVSVTAGATSTVMVALAAPAGSAGGFARLETPIEMQVFEGGQLIGTTTASRLMLPAGRHDLEVGSVALEFRAPIRIDIQAGRTTTVNVPIPNGSLSVNALPWAEVLIDGQPAGTTPLGNLTVPIGTHEIVWRHPQLGERSRTVTVPARTPVRLGMDLSR